MCVYVCSNVLIIANLVSYGLNVGGAPGRAITRHSYALTLAFKSGKGRTADYGHIISNTNIG